MILNWTKDRILKVGDLTLLPGMNEVSDEQWLVVRGDVKDHLDRKNLLEVHAEVVKKVDPETKKEVFKIESAKTLKQLAAKEAEEVVKQTFNLKTLGKWLKEEARDSVRVEIRNQIDSVNKFGEDKAKEKSDASRGSED